MGDSVPKHTGPISLTDPHLEPSVLRTRPTTTRENRQRWKGLIPRDTQASIKRDVKKKVLPRPEGEKICLEIQPTSLLYECLSICARGFASQLSSIPVAFLVRWCPRQSSLETWQA